VARVEQVGRVVLAGLVVQVEREAPAEPAA
jgi:hypothetical protein